MTIYPQTLLDHLAGEATTVCHCWKLTRADATVIGFTDHDRTLSVGGTIYRPRSGLTASEAKDSLGGGIDASDVEGVLSDEDVTEADIAAGLYDGARVETLLVDWRDTARHAVLRHAKIGKIERRDGRFVAELEGATASLDRLSGRTVRRRCDAELGDQRCGVALAGYTAGGVVTAVSGGEVTATGLGSFAPGWFEHGVVTFTSGGAAGRTARVMRDRREGALRHLGFWLPEKAVAPGDAFTIVAGCDKTFATCRTKFDNRMNFRGFPHLPGNDAAYAYANGEAVFDGGALVP